MNPIAAVLNMLARRAIGLSEADMDDLVTPGAIDRMWAEAAAIAEDYAALDRLEKAGYFPVCAACGRDRDSCPSSCPARGAGGWER